jgi:signal transduction histidine kinase/DNA-binding response OmpR family regulator/ligand-binding sensor domain-containing protein
MKQILLILFLVSQIVSFSQPIRFQHLTNAEGISQSEVYAFLEDSRGFMWIGTLDGLNRYDGYDTTIFNIEKNNPNSIPNNTIRCIKEDRFGRIWIGTDDGLCVYNPLSEKINQVKISCIADKTALQIQALNITKDFILLGTSSGLIRANINSARLDEIEKDLQLVHFSKNDKVNISDIVFCKNGSTWIATSAGIYGMVFQNEKTPPLVIERILDSKFLNNISVILKEDKYNNIWIITHERGFYRFNPITKKIDSFSENLPNATVVSELYSAAETDKKGNLWISTRDKGLLFLDAAKLNDAQPQFKNIKNNPIDDKSLNSNLIYSLYVTKNNVLWVGTIGSGINIYDPQQKEFNHLKIPFINGQMQSSSNFVRSVYNDQEGNIWIGTQNNGLYVVNRKNKSFRKAGFGSQSLFFIYDIGGGNTVICSSKGVSVVQLVNNEAKLVDTHFSDAYFNACKSKQDIVWLAGLGGITKCKIINGNLKVEQVYCKSSKPKISLNNCRVLFYHKESNELLAGTEGGGLNILKLDNQHNVTSVQVFKKNNTTNSISNNYIRSIIKDSKGNFWIGTFEGLNKLIYNSKSREITFKSYTKKEGLPNNMIQSLIEDNQKKIWIGTNGGLSKFDLQNERFVNYTVSEGLQSNEFSEHTAYKKADGEIIMGGINGINTFYPEKIQSSNNLPKTTITNFYLFNKKVDISDSDSRTSPLSKSITLTDTLLLDSDENSFGFDFSAMLHTTPEKVKYAYMLEGFDEDWHYTDAKNRRAYYTNLTHGKYILLVKSTNIDGKWEGKPRQIYIKIKTPFVYSWIAIILYFLLFIVIMVYLTNYSVIKYTTKNKLVLDNVHKNKMHELDELRNRFFINISHDLRTPLTLISSPLDQVLKNENLSPDIQYHLKLAKKNVKKLRYITEQLLDFSKAEAGKLSAIRKNQNIISFIKKEVTHFTYALKSKGLEFEITSNEEEIYTCFDSDMISKVIFNILSNAIKHTQEGEININVERISHSLPETLNTEKYNSFIRIDIQDSGEGIEQQELNKIFDRFYQANGEKEKGFGIGLSHCKDLIEAHEGIIEASSEKGIGTTFSIYIPDVQLNTTAKDSRSNSDHQQDVYKESINIIDHENEAINTKIVQKILVIEDNADMRKFICHELKKEYKVIEAEDGVEGLVMAEKFSPDLIISDVMMPNMDGIEFCKKIKSDLKTSHIPVVLLTAKTEDVTKYEGIKMGADDYISKPFEMEYLVLRIKNILKSREQLRKLFQLNNSLNPSAITVSSLDEKFLSQLMKEMENGLSDPEFTVISLEEKMGMSHSNFYRKIKNITGQSGKDILLDMRMKRAKQILTDNKGIRVSEVAYMVGYSNPKYFSQSFKDYYGVLPSEIEKSNDQT